MTGATGWTCEHCGRRFARRNQQHVCERWTVDDHLSVATPAALALYSAFVERLRSCGDFEFEPIRRQIGFRGPRRIFAGVSLRGGRLVGYLDLPRKVSSPRFREAADYTKRLWVHHFVLDSVEQIDDEFAGWMAESLAVGHPAVD
jgi:hypothetical protein